MDQSRTLLSVYWCVLYWNYLIQSCFQARRAFRTLKGIVRLQAFIRGHLVRRQAVATLFCLRSIVKLQMLARSRKVKIFSLNHYCGLPVWPQAWSFAWPFLVTHYSSRDLSFLYLREYMQRSCGKMPSFIRCSTIVVFCSLNYYKMILLFVITWQTHLIIIFGLALLP